MKQEPATNHEKKKALLFGQVSVKVSGLSLEKLITRAAEQGVGLLRVQRQDVRTLTATLATRDLPALRRIAEAVGWRVTVERASLLGRSQSLLSYRAMLACGLAVFLALVWMANACVWFVRVEGAGESIGEVRAVLAEWEVRPGRLTATLDLQGVQQALEARLPRVAWIDVRLRGVTVVVECVPARMPTPATYGGEPCDIVASRDGVVTGVTVYAGIAKVKVGDAVRKGQVLVTGEERTADGGIRPVAARAQVLSRVWYTGSARLPATEHQSTPTGATWERRVLCTPWLRWSDTDESPFAEQDIHIHRQVVGGVFVPVWVQEEHYAEVVLDPVLRDRAELERESAALAEQRARESMPFHAQILDKWVEYSMIKDSYFMAEVVLETVEDIAIETTY
ncbi:MAG: sporulation protein YqfD [Clostridia bacterium]|nr:sporulation protein YqfD [Clostridia bacterium]